MYVSRILLAIVCCFQTAYAVEPVPPNILIILADDMGYSDLGCIGWEMATQRSPNGSRLRSFFGFLTRFADHFTGAPSYRLDREPFTDFGIDYYSTDAFSDRANDFIQSTPTEKPFFLYLSLQAPHNPLQAPKEDILRLRGKYIKGWQAVREARLPRQQHLAVDFGRSG